MKAIAGLFGAKKEAAPTEPQATPAAPETNENMSKLLEQNQKLISLLASVISEKGLRVDGMNDLASAVASMPGEGDTNNVNFNDNGGGQQTGFDLRKKQV